ncbi:MAG: hypothetical protein UW30_C0019G0006 [Candidatus Giovannonibacteria bacterium GW2011_GWA2_44_13b]|uniref:Addiction module toxin, RelE/StbE family n=2 Tax=Candidatus Giovannoniibacteriota TaxID=1752738 RepID=A0A0G1J9K9_9BACT|nr:MAG: hypothetical protein UW30_C0019G0006 [Candidatus Giovannonibacteria bacterium GW2011_GWA2_44_13b]OGF82766.1 MAG: hypothetical protein A2924_03520 [Candidatus Giovannonibacteria bacterium RIFCSPLOWO2_01_FULL_44_16]
MPEWYFDITPEAERDLDKLDVPIRRRVVERLSWFQKNFTQIIPLPLGGRLGGFFKLRVGDWRIIYEINESAKKVTIHAIDKRDKIYKRK